MSERHALGQKALSCHEFLMFDQVNAVVDPRGDKFLEACRAEDKPAAQVIREFMREYVAKRQAEAQGSLFAAEPLERNR